MDVARTSSLADGGDLSLVWFRVGDLRLRDHEPLANAFGKMDQSDPEENTVVPFVVLQEQPITGKVLDERQKNVPTVSVYRQEAIKRAIGSLSEDLESRGSRLIILKDDWRAGLTAIVNCAAKQGCSKISLHYYMSSHTCIDPLGHKEQENMLATLSSFSDSFVSIEYYPCWGRTLFHPQDMCRHSASLSEIVQNTISATDVVWNSCLRTHYPESLEIIQSCDNMTRFRDACQGLIPVREPLDIPDVSLCTWNLEEYLSMVREYCVSPSELCTDNPHSNIIRDDIPVIESQVNTHLERILSDSKCMSSYRKSRMSASTSQRGAMLSTAMSLGTISPRSIYETVKRALLAKNPEWKWKSEIQASSPGEEWLLMHLVIRDYFLYLSESEAEIISKFGDEHDWSNNIEHFDRWTQGLTGFPFVDASMRELNGTGFMSNRGRQNVASFLTKALNIDWRWGELYFSKMLIDYEPGVNIESWAYVAGVGPGRRNSKFFTVTQGEKYDPDATLISEWIPELRDIDARFQHRPWLISDKSSVSQYPQPIIPDTSSQCQK